MREITEAFFEENFADISEILQEEEIDPAGCSVLFPSETCGQVFLYAPWGMRFLSVQDQLREICTAAGVVSAFLFVDTSLEIGGQKMIVPIKAKLFMSFEPKPAFAAESEAASIVSTAKGPGFFVANSESAAAPYTPTLARKSPDGSQVSFYTPAQPKRPNSPTAVYTPDRPNYSQQPASGARRVLFP